MRVTDFSDVLVVCNSRAERGPLESVIKAMPGCYIFGEAANWSGDPDHVMAMALDVFSFEFKVRKPKVVVVLGDRYETLGAAQAAMFLNIPIAHIHGGERTFGAFDDAMRDSITHMAQFHFAAAPAFQERILQLRSGCKRPYRVYTCGAPGLDGMPQNSAKRDERHILVTFHPETNALDRGLRWVQLLLQALREFKDHRITFCGVNTDPGGKEIEREIQTYCLMANGRSIIENMGHAGYLRAMQHADLVVGNSSAGIIEAPWVGIPTVNIGRRQEGRPLARSVFQFGLNDVKALVHTMEDAMDFRGNPMPEYQGGAAPKIAKILGEYLWQQNGAQHEHETHPG